MYCKLRNIVEILNAEVDKDKSLSSKEKAERKITQAKLAEQIPLAKGTVNKLFNNKFDRIEIGTVDALCDYFGCEVGDLFSRYSPADEFLLNNPPPHDPDDDVMPGRGRLGNFLI